MRSKQPMLPCRPSEEGPSSTPSGLVCLLTSLEGEERERDWASNDDGLPCACVANGVCRRDSSCYSIYPCHGADRTGERCGLPGISCAPRLESEPREAHAPPPPSHDASPTSGATTSLAT